VVLNIAEGNGRPLEADHRQFLETAESSVVKAATYLDLCERTAQMEQSQRQSGMALLERVALLVRGLARRSGWNSDKSTGKGDPDKV
jgi:four helix bundle protein